MLEEKSNIRIFVFWLWDFLVANNVPALNLCKREETKFSEASGKDKISILNKPGHM
jgi:hypothetical protein